MPTIKANIKTMRNAPPAAPASSGMLLLAARGATNPVVETNASDGVVSVSGKESYIRFCSNGKVDRQA